MDQLLVRRLLEIAVTLLGVAAIAGLFVVARSVEEARHRSQGRGLNDVAEHRIYIQRAWRAAAFCLVCVAAMAAIDFGLFR